MASEKLKFKTNEAIEIIDGVVDIICKEYDLAYGEFPESKYEGQGIYEYWEEEKDRIVTIFLKASRGR